MKDYFYETVEAPNGNKVTRLRSALFYWCALVTLCGGTYLLTQKVMFGGFLVLTLAPCLLLYPLVRFLFGGKDSVAGVIATVVLEELAKGEVIKAIEKSSKKKRRHR